jgi:hypothetical protein
VNASLIDPDRTTCLCDAGNPDYLAATAVAADGSEHLLLAECDGIGDENVCYDPGCTDVDHEQLGALPIEYVRRLTISRRTHHCGRPTKTTGRPCRIEVTTPGEACGLHRQRPAVARCRWCAVPLQQPDSISHGLCGECRLTAEKGIGA